MALLKYHEDLAVCGCMTVCTATINVILMHCTILVTFMEV